MGNKLSRKWEMVKINDACSLITDGTHQTPTYSDEGYLFLSSKNVTSGSIDWENVKYVGEELHEKLYKRLAPQLNDILLAKNGTTGVCAKVDKDIVFDIYVSLALLRPTEIINPDYFLFAINNPYTKRKFDSHLKGIGVPNLHLSSIKETKIPLPPLEEQQKIAKNLDLASDLVKLYKTKLSELDKLIQSVFYDMFGDPVTNEKGWEVRKLKKLSSSINSGNTPKGGQQVYVNDGIMFFRSQNVWKDNIKLDDIAYIDSQTHENMSKSSLKHGDILMTKTGRINTENSSLGRAAIYLGEDDKANVNGHVYFIRLLGGVERKFILKILTSKEYRGHIRSVCVGGIDKRQLNKSHIEDFPIIFPPLPLQQEFADIITKIEEQKTEVNHALQDAEMLYNSLMQEYFE